MRKRKILTTLCMKKNNLCKKMKRKVKLISKMKCMLNKTINSRNNTKLKKNKSQEKDNQKRSQAGLSMMNNHLKKFNHLPNIPQEDQKIPFLNTCPKNPSLNTMFQSK